MYTNNDSLAKRALQQEFDKNQNSPGFKMVRVFVIQVIKQAMKGVEDRAYWYFTTDQAEFLSNVYVKQVEEQMLRRRLNQITEEALNDVCKDIISGQMTKSTPQQQQLVTTVRILEKVETIAAQGNDYYSPDHPLARQNIQKIKQIHDDYKSFKEKIDYLKQKERERKLQKEHMEKQIQQKIQQEKKLEYHKEVMKRLEIMRMKQEQRIEQNQKFKHFLKQFKKSKPLHMLMEQEFKEKVQLPQLEQSRKKLELFKHKKKPTLQEINDHERAYMTIKQSRPQKAYIKHQTLDVGYKSEFYKKIEEEEKNGYDDEYSSMVWDQMQKKKRYSLMVKENFKPKTSRVHHESLTIDDSQKRKSQKKIAPDLSRVKEIGKFYLQYVKSLEKNRSNTAIVSQQQDIQQQQSGKMSRSRYTNYLDELKKSHQGSIDKKYRGFGSNWQSDLNDRTASKSERRDRVMIKSKQLEEKALRDETFVKNFNYGKAEDIIGKKKEIDETLLEAIRAKMALLKDVKSDY